MVGIVNWRKSSYSGSNSGNCVEVADDRRRIMVRDTQDRTGPTLKFNADVWRRFVKGQRSLGPAGREGSIS
jgi:uncharacterized protein DUF397